MKGTGGYMIRQKFRLVELYLTKVYDEQKGYERQGEGAGERGQERTVEGIQTGHHKYITIADRNSIR
jgi:hypothetical protein